MCVCFGDLRESAEEDGKEIHKKLSHKTKDKMQRNIKVILQVDENLARL